ncbi:Rieske (2Fe-2S) protein, partial [Pseudomonas aeruginosa]
STLSLGDPMEPARKATADMLRSRDHRFSLQHPFYCDQRLFEIDMTEIFHKDWLIAGMTCKSPDKGNFLTLQIGKNPLLVMRC